MGVRVYGWMGVFECVCGCIGVCLNVGVSECVCVGVQVRLEALRRSLFTECTNTILCTNSLSTERTCNSTLQNTEGFLTPFMQSSAVECKAASARSPLVAAAAAAVGYGGEGKSEGDVSVTRKVLLLVLRAVCCIVSQGVAGCCNTQARAYTHIHTNSHTRKVLPLASRAVCCSVLQCVAVRFSVLRCVAMCCSVLQYTSTHIHINTRALTQTKYVAVGVACSVWQCVAMCCSVLQCVATCRNVLQYASTHTHTHTHTHADKRCCR